MEYKKLSVLGKLLNALAVTGIFMCTFVVYIIKYPAYVGEWWIFSFPSLGYYTEVVFLPILMVSLIHITAVTLNRPGITLFDKRITKVYLAQALIWLPLIFIQTRAFRFELLYDFEILYQYEMIFSMVFVFVAAGIVVKDLTIEEAFKHNFKVLKRNFLHVLLCYLIFFIAYKLMRRVVYSIYGYNYLVSEMSSAGYSAIRFVIITLLTSLIFIRDDNKQESIKALEVDKVILE